ncbi:uncharacterized protein LOC113344057 isoform X1 [Papaver somniferum]|uniref:uncharacterized protein LOC113344057 isoform X1 n=1 Tax=Papaver somniferum TaxID=3469 RepID=UPI000E6F742F|nr:uncharacterized protein LOC113344057 isoform X1 [Papaver somniferum]
MAMHIRVKREKTTYFVQCDPTETILDIKQKLHTLIDQPVNDQRLILLETGHVLEDSKTLADQKMIQSLRISKLTSQMKCTVPVKQMGSEFGKLKRLSSKMEYGDLLSFVSVRWLVDFYTYIISL